MRYTEIHYVLITNTKFFAILVFIINSNMPEKSKAIDDYIEKSAVFAKPILNHLRKLVHSACPDVEEKMKWSFHILITREK